MCPNIGNAAGVCENCSLWCFMSSQRIALKQAPGNMLFAFWLDSHGVLRSFHVGV